MYIHSYACHDRAKTHSQFWHHQNWPPALRVRAETRSESPSTIKCCSVGLKLVVKILCTIYTCDMTHWYVWHDLFIDVTWPTHMCDMTPLYVHTLRSHPYIWHDSFVYVTWRFHTCDMTHSCLWHDAFIHMGCLIRICDITHSYVWHHSCTCVTWHIHVQHDSFICVTWRIHT